MLALILAATFALPPQASDAVIGVAAVDLKTGKRISIRGDERFPMGSVYKVPIALEVLRTQQLDRVITIEPKDFSPGWSPLRDEAKGKPIVMTVEQLAEAMVKLSDNTACDALLRIVTPQAVTKLMPDGIRVDRQEREMAADLRKPGGRERYASDPRDTATPDAMLGLFTSIAKDRPEKLMRWMTETTTGPKRIKAGLPKGTIVAHKTGTMPGTTNDVAIIDGRYVIAIFTKASKMENEDVEPDIAAVTRAVHEELTRSR
ncbi:MAG TPA: class A beta-lactamase [Thermoanaerobaculia bacterium]|nr:class A beta-lactamase [Thermoanaerobaculia bacterium]